MGNPVLRHGKKATCKIARIVGTCRVVCVKGFILLLIALSTMSLYQYRRGPDRDYDLPKIVDSDACELAWRDDAQLSLWDALMRVVVRYAERAKLLATMSGAARTRYVKRHGENDFELLLDELVTTASPVTQDRVAWDGLSPDIIERYVSMAARSAQHHDASATHATPSRLKVSVAVPTQNKPKNRRGNRGGRKVQAARRRAQNARRRESSTLLKKHGLANKRFTITTKIGDRTPSTRV